MEELAANTDRNVKCATLALTLPLHRPEPDIATAEPVGPADAIDRLVRPRLRLRDRLAERADVEHATAVREDAPAIGFGAGVKDLDPFDLRGGIEPFDDRSFGRGTWIPLGRHHHGQRGVGVPT